ncbi:MAG: methyltransferase domain-containing protein [Bacteroidales bacterium]|nr:methyltransferase domain-containing protein [Bacteroidales bacterium]
MSSDLIDAYNRLAVDYDKNRGLFDMSAVLREFYACLEGRKGHLLDLGCGAGEPGPAFFIDKGWKVTGVDFSEKMLELAGKYQPGMNSILADITKVAFLPEQFDAVTAIYSLFHIEKEKHPKLFYDLYQWLKPGGKMLFTYACKEYTGHAEFSGYIRFMSENLFYSHTTPQKLYAMLEATGFDLLARDYRDIGGERFLWVALGKPA